MTGRERDWKSPAACRRNFTDFSLLWGCVDMERAQATRFSFRRKGSQQKGEREKERAAAREAAAAATEFDYEKISYVRYDHSLK